MKKGNGIALTIAAVFAALGIGIITGGTLVSSDNSTSTTATQTEDVVPDVPVPVSYTHLTLPTICSV